MPKFTKGVARFKRDVYPKNQELFERLSHGQSPEALFITCSDSRIETALMTQTEPGDLFVCRNAGNLVPPHSAQTTGITASIEYAVSVLRVPHIVVCGHSGCGAMAGAMNPEGLDALPHVRAWLARSEAAVARVREQGSGLTEDEQMAMLIEQNVVQQLEHLRTHPSVAARIAADDIELHGWVYDIKTGDISVYSAEAERFVEFEERYADDVEGFFDQD